ncbi:uncharacterized protein C2orf73-like [Engraulis encrasicolus]|uniref:uncharacterized protein C2orf73-like n=1 Tax=Engraulis encrasicolus TaxID=184585 RepID=UPI002FD68B39
MYQRAEICLPRKKKVHGTFHSNTFRIFDENIPVRLEPHMVYWEHKYDTRSRAESELLKTHNVPQPYNAKFISTNVRFLNAPVVHMETHKTKEEQCKWWAAAPACRERSKASYCANTTQRADYQPHTTGLGLANQINGQRGRPHATAIIPTLHPINQPKSLLEHMSFTHQYDSRKLHNQPYQGGKHGTFVWTEMQQPLSGGQKSSGGAPAMPTTSTSSLDPNPNTLIHQNLQKRSPLPCIANPYIASSSTPPNSWSHPPAGGWGRRGTGRGERGRVPGDRRAGSLSPGSRSGSGAAQGWGQGGKGALATGRGPQNVEC